MKTLLAAVAVLALAACGEEAPKPTVVPVTPTPAPQTAAPVPEAKPVAPAPEAAKPDPNKELASRVKRALDEAKIYGIDPSAADGKVTLWGTAGTEADRKRAASVATKVEGVASVDNQIKIVKGS